jgi:hypothetical protein
LPNVPHLPTQLNIEDEWSTLEASVQGDDIAVLPCAATVQAIQQVCVQ